MTVMQIHWNICHICGSIGLNIRQKIETEKKDTCRNNVQDGTRVEDGNE